MATIRERAGKWQVQVRRSGYPSLTRSFVRKSDATIWARQMEVQADRREITTSRHDQLKEPLSELVHRYIKDVVSKKQSAFVEEAILRAFLRHDICNKPVGTLKAGDFAAYRDQRLKEISPVSLKRQLNPIRHMFEVARDEWGIPIKENPLDRVKLTGTDQRRERRLKEGELERIIEAARQRRNPLILPIVLYALETAMRRGEILGMRWGHVDLKRASVVIPEAKNGYSRTIPLTPTALALLQRIRGEGQKGDDEKVFPVTANALRLTWERLRQKAGCPDLHFHDLRHEAISRYFEMGLTVPEVASISGHRDIRMLLRYAHSSNESLRKKLAKEVNSNVYHDFP